MRVSKWITKDALHLNTGEGQCGSGNEGGQCFRNPEQPQNIVIE